MSSAHLDYEIAMKQKLKSILTGRTNGKFEKKGNTTQAKKGAMKKQPKDNYFLAWFWSLLGKINTFCNFKTTQKDENLFKIITFSFVMF